MTDPRRYRPMTLAVGWSMLLAPFLLIIGFGLHLYVDIVTDPAPGASYLQRLTDDYAALSSGHAAVLIAIPLLLAAGLGLAWLLWQRRPGLALGASALVILGGVLMGALFGALTLAPSAMATVPADQITALEPGQAAIAAFDGWMPLARLGFLLPVGLALLAAGLFWERTVPRWTSLAVGIGAIMLLFDPNDPIQFTGSVALQLGLGAIAVRLLRRPAPAPKPPSPTSHQPTPQPACT